ncbi:hypothetical protein [Deinococcus planocerae]|uniref:hypothetical protein n=1 Tax=Deinococcus planocerae TaxID=1737569 RepID=UPI0011AFA17E|nr:hypothetical protein [Deinococcus planocerae]
MRLAEAVLTLWVRAAQGETVQTPSGTLTPVALVACGVGAGSDEAENGGGGGGGGSLPLGAWVSDLRGTRSVPNTVVLASVVLGGLAGIMRAWRR